MTASDLPVLCVVDADREACAVTESALLRRFGADYRVLSADSAKAGLDLLRRLTNEGDDVALVAADLHLPGTDGVEFLERAHALHRDATRLLGHHG
jgi:thioredoxin reductase (NADPH)